MFVKSSHNAAHRALGLSAVVTIVALICGGHIVPIYDGIGFPDEPYRYINSGVSSSKTLPPTTAESVVTMANGTNAGFVNMASTEQGPQISLYLAAKSVVVDPAVTTLDIQAQPKVVSQSDQPTDGVVAGDIYTVMTDQPAKFTDQAHVSVLNLRIPVVDQSNGVPAIEYRPASSTGWKRLNTTRVGSDIYQAAFAGFGDYAVVTLKASVSSVQVTKASQSFAQKLTVPIVAVVVVMLLILVAIMGIRLAGRQNKRAIKRSSKSD